MALTYIKVFLDCLEAIEPLDDGERGRLFTALLQYARTGEVPALQGNERFLFPALRGQMDRDAAAYEAVCEANRINGAKGGRSRANKAGASESSQDKEKDKEKDKDKNKEKKEKDDSVCRSRGLRSGPFLERCSYDPETARKDLERMDRYLKQIRREARERRNHDLEKEEA